MHTWRDVYSDLERASKGIEYWAAGRFLTWSLYFMFQDPYVGDNVILQVFTRRLYGGLLLLVVGLLWLGALCEFRSLSGWSAVLIRKSGCVIALLLSSAIGFGIAIAVANHTPVPGGYSSLLSLLPFTILVFIALMRPRRQYHVGL